MSTKIKTLAQLKEEKKKLKIQMEVSKKAFIHSFGTTQSQAKDFLVKKVALPAGAVGLATVGAKHFFSNSSSQKSTSNNNRLLKNMVPVVLPFIQSFLSEPERLKMLPLFLQEIIALKVAVKKERQMEDI